MAGELHTVLSRMLSDFEKMDFDAVAKAAAHDMQGIDELSRSWIRSRKDLTDYFKKVSAMVTKIHDTKLNDVHETIVGDVGILTCWLEQDYTLEGKEQHISAPTTAIFKREDGAWKAALFHSLPLPETGG